MRRNSPLTREAVLEAATETIRRFGPDKATVVDVAQALEVSHGSVYRFFRSKEELREAVVENWLTQISSAMESFRQGNRESPPQDGLKDWFLQLNEIRRRQRHENPELFEAFRQLTGQSAQAFLRYRKSLLEQIRSYLCEAANAGGLWSLEGLDRQAELIFLSLTRTYHPYFAAEWDDPDWPNTMVSLVDITLRGSFSPRSLS